MFSSQFLIALRGVSTTSAPTRCTEGDKNPIFSLSFAARECKSFAAAADFFPAIVSAQRYYNTSGLQATAAHANLIWAFITVIISLFPHCQTTNNKRAYKIAHTQNLIVELTRTHFICDSIWVLTVNHFYFFKCLCSSPSESLNWIFFWALLNCVHIHIENCQNCLNSFY